MLTKQERAEIAERLKDCPEKQIITIFMKP